MDDKRTLLKAIEMLTDIENDLKGMHEERDQLIKALESMVKIADNLIEYVQMCGPESDILNAKNILKQAKGDK